ncbi:MAG: hypothetical protein GXY44_04360 [Phycisphaerales bacterium]|nr:hypothetical protein [Phycisphaerales bacterium]
MFIKRSIPTLLLMAVITLALGSCAGIEITTGAEVNPFQELPPIALDGQEQELRTDLAPLGELVAGQVLRLKVSGPAVKAALILTADTELDDTGRLAGGGPPNQSFQYRVQVPGPYYVYIQFDPQAGGRQLRATITAEPGDPDYRPPSRQVVRVVFLEGYLTEPGLYDPDSMTDDEKQLLVDLSDLVAEGIVDRLRTIFADTPIEIVAEDEPLPDEPYSTLYYDPRRVLADEQDIHDVALPPADPTRPECQVRVIFGEVLPRGLMQDPGNRVLDDEAAVYVGSYQGRGATCRTRVTDSVNNMVLALAQTGAHEIGHLVGLMHTEQVTLMHRSATLAFMRELAFDRGQVQIETGQSTDVFTEVLTPIIQDPSFYWQTNFSRP